MDQAGLLRRIKLLSSFKPSKVKGKYTSLDCDDTLIHGLCELCMNILRGEKEIPLNKKILKKLLPFRSQLHKLSKSGGSVNNKRKTILEVCPYFVPILRKSILPALKKLYKKNQLVEK